MKGQSLNPTPRLPTRSVRRAGGLVPRFINTLTYFSSCSGQGIGVLFDSFQQAHQILASESPFKRLSNGFVVTLEVEQAFCQGRKG
jgi:hypothetical protein